MTTKLDAALKREIAVDGVAYTVTMDAHGLKVVKKGSRKGPELTWKAIVTGEAALMTSLSQSIQETSGRNDD